MFWRIANLYYSPQLSVAQVASKAMMSHKSTWRGWLVRHSASAPHDCSIDASRLRVCPGQDCTRIWAFEELLVIFFLVYTCLYGIWMYLICRWYAHHRTSMHFLHCLPSRVSILTYLRTKAWTRQSAFAKSSTSRHRKSWETSGHRWTWV